MGWGWPASESEALSAAMHAWNLLKEVAIIFITSNIVWLRSSKREGTQHRPSEENWIKDLLSMAPPIRPRPSLPQVSLTGQEASISLLPSPSEGRQTENHNHRKLTSLITWNTACLTQWNYEPCGAGPPKTGGSWWRVLTKCGPLEKGMANRFSILTLRTPWSL